MVKNEIMIRYKDDHKIIETNFESIDSKLYDNIDYLEINLLDSSSIPMPFPKKLKYLVIDLATYNYTILNVNYRYFRRFYENLKISK